MVRSFYRPAGNGVILIKEVMEITKFIKFLQKILKSDQSNYILEENIKQEFEICHKKEPDGYSAPLII